MDALHSFAKDSGLRINLGKTKVMVFNTTAQWVKRSTPTLIYDQVTVEYTNAYTYVGVLFTRPRFTSRRATETRLSGAYAALGGLERMCSQVQFQEPQKSYGFLTP